MVEKIFNFWRIQLPGNIQTTFKSFYKAISVLPLSALFLLFLSPPVAIADGVICYDANNSFSVEPPKGWVADYEIGRQFGLCVMFYLSGYDFNASPAVFYPRLVTETRKDSKGQIDIEDFISADLRHFVVSGTFIESLPELKTVFNLNFRIRKISNGPPPNEFEVVGYLPAKDAVFLGVLSTRKAAYLEKNMESFKAFLALMKPIERNDLFNQIKNSADKDKEIFPDFENTFIASIGHRLGDAMKTCIDKDSEDFDAVMQISDEGVIADWLNENNGHLGMCVSKIMKGQKGIRPPLSPFHIFLRMTLAP